MRFAAVKVFEVFIFIEANLGVMSLSKQFLLK
jgi:hypothetical protein